MLKEGLEKLQEIIRKSEEAKTFEINGETYYPRNLALVKAEKEIHQPESVTVNNLDGLAKIITKELDKSKLPLFISITSPTNVEVFSTFVEDEMNKRHHMYKASCRYELPEIDFGRYMSNEEMIITLRSKFIPTPDLEYALGMISKISEKTTIEADDNGMCQTVQIKKGLALVENAVVKPIVNLKPYRTFFEVEQPESEFLLRFKEGGQVALFEADGGMWKTKAQSSICYNLGYRLSNEIEAGKVVVLA